VGASRVEIQPSCGVGIWPAGQGQASVEIHQAHVVLGPSGHKGWGAQWSGDLTGLGGAGAS
jgi:hypothetical protein